MVKETDRLAKFLSNRRRLPAQFLQREGIDPAELPIQPRTREQSHYPVSFAQRRLWFLDRLNPGSAAYNIPLAMRLTGALNQDALGRTLSEIIRRHEVLRTTFAEHDGEPRQVIHPPRPLHLEAEELGATRGASEREAEMLRLAREEAQRPFDLEAGPLLRVTLLRLGDEEHVMLLTKHHIVSDGWSMGVLFKEMRALYSAYVRGEESPLPELAIQYADFALWQRGELAGRVLEQQLSYWGHQLGGKLPVRELPTDFPRAAGQSHRGANECFLLPAELTERLKELCRRRGATLYMTLLAAWQVTLSHDTGQGEVVVGSPIANRNRADIEPLIGFFTNMLLLRTDLSGASSFREALRRVREVCLGAYEHQDLPFDKLVEGLRPGCDLSWSSLFQARFSLENTEGARMELEGLELEGVRVGGTEATRFELSLSMREAGGGLVGVLTYRRELFTPERMRGMCEHYRRVLENALSEPEE